MKAYKDGKYLVFEFEEVDEHAGKNVKFDLSTGDFISPTGKKVKSLDRYLNKYPVDFIINSFENENYRKYLRFIKDMVSYHNNIIDSKVTINNILLGAKKYMQLEKFYAYGVELQYNSCHVYENIPWTQEKIDAYEKEHCTKLYYIPRDSFVRLIKFEDVPKTILEFYKEHKMMIKYNVCKTEYKDEIIQAINKVKNMKKEYKDYIIMFFYALLGDNYNISPIFSKDSDIGDYMLCNSFFKANMLLKDCGYDFNKLAEYIEYLMNIEHIGGMDDDWKITKNGGPVEIMNQLYEYNFMMKKLYGDEKYDKYPKNFLTTKNIITYKYNSLLRKEKEEKMSRNIYKKELEWEDSGFVFISPRTPKEIELESQNMHNCVASYINSVLEDHCSIVFMRQANNPDKSYITLEVNNNSLRVTQAKRKCNRSLSYKEGQIVNEYNKYLDKVRNRRNQMKMSNEISNVKELELEIERRA